ncbi:HAD family hydrolase [Candidatus Gottesmanbacteria bacterium]|nr:HAD family hydrolase [Candidatus Gottesmanbacteria bacterium]MBI3577631.1 HAD family hydrolase [Candidatus Gottesmanbacteria bacterium]
MRKLVLFDIDGTLTNRTGDLKESLWRFPYAAKKLFDVELHLTVDDYMSYNGWVDKAQFWDQLKGTGVTREEYLRKFPKFGQYTAEYMDLHKPQYRVNEGVKELLEYLQKQKNLSLGVITGNAEKVAWWKLEQAGLRRFFSFGLFGDEADTRSELAEKAFEKAEKHFHIKFVPEQVTMVGDTTYDVACARHIGAKIVFLVTDGKNSSLTKDQKPDLIIASFADPAVRDFLKA